METHRLFQIYESDLCDLEKILPDLASVLASQTDPRLRTQLRRVQQILSNVRWGYGPIDCVENFNIDS